MNGITLPCNILVPNIDSLPDVFAAYTTESSSRRFSIGSPGK